MSTQSSNALVLAPDQIASNKLALALGLERDAMLTTIKAQCFRNMNPDQVSNAMLATFVQVAQTLEVNPLLPGMLYAYPERNGGITPIIGPDGIFKLLSSRPDILGWSSKHETIDGEKACTATIKHKNLGEITKTVFLSEWRVPNNPNWVTRPRHMLEIRALKQCARQIIHGIPMDLEEHKAIIDLDDPAYAAPTDTATTTTGDTVAGDAGTAGGEASGSGTATTEQRKRASVPKGKGKGASALTAAPSEPKNVTPPAAPAEPTPEPQLGAASPEKKTPAVIDVEPEPAPEPAKPTEPAPTEAAPPPTSSKPVPEPAADDDGYKPRYPQPEGFPKVFEAHVAFAAKQKGDYEKRDGTKVTNGELTIVTLGGDAIVKNAILGKGVSGSPVAKVVFDPENAALLAIAKPSVATFSVTIEMWPSQARPGQFVPVATRFEDEPAI